MAFLNARAKVGCGFLLMAMVLLSAAAFDIEPAIRFPETTGILTVSSATFGILLVMDKAIRDSARVGSKSRGDRSVNVERFLAIVQTLGVIGGLVYAGYQLKQAKDAFQASTVSQLSERSADIQWKVLTTSDLAPLLAGGENPDALQQQGIVAGMIINHFATLFDVRQLGGIPDEAWGSFEADLAYTMSRPAFRTRWKSLKGQHNQRFVSYVDGLLAKMSID